MLVSKIVQQIIVLHLSKKLVVQCSGITVYHNKNANEISNFLSLLNYTKRYVDIVGQDQFFYLDSSTGTTEGRLAEALYNEGFARRKILTDGASVNKFSIPLNLYSYFAAFKNNVYLNIKTSILIELENDNNIIFSEMLLLQLVK